MTREEAIEKLKLYDNYFYGMWGKDKCRNVFDVAIEALKAEPVKHGEWVASRVGESSSWFVECSKCHVVMPPVNYTYCPHCGAKMDGGKK